MITNILLAIIAVLLLARVIIAIAVLRTPSKSYASTSAVEKTYIVGYRIVDILEQLGKEEYESYELNQIVKEDRFYYAFLTRKKIKNYMEK